LSFKDVADYPESLPEIVYFGASLDGKKVLALTDNHVARVWDAKSGAQLLERRDARGFSPDGKFLLAFTGGMKQDSFWEPAKIQPWRAERVEVATGRRVGKLWKTAPKSPAPGEEEDMPVKVFF